MAIEVGALMLAIGADNRAALRALEQLDRAGEDSDRANTRYALNQLNLSFKREQALLREEKALQRYKAAIRNAAADPTKGGAPVDAARERYEESMRRRVSLDNRIAAASVAAEQTVANERRRVADLTANFGKAEESQAIKKSELQRRLDAEQLAESARYHLAKQKFTEQETAKETARGARANVANAEYQLARRRAEEKTANAAEEKAARQNRLNAEYHLARMRYAKQEAAQQANTARQQRLDAEAADRRTRAAAARAAREAAGAARGLYRPFGGGMGGGLSTFGVTGTLVGAGALAGILRAANDFQIMQQRLAQVAESGLEVRVLFDELTSSSNRLRVPVADVTELFTKLRQSNSILGLTYGQTIKVTNAFSAALRISGATGQTAASSLLQFGQAMSKGKLDGDEFRTVAENASEVLRVLERQLGLTRGEILKMREEGKLTAKMMADALIAEVEDLEKKVSKLAPSISQASVSFRNSVIEMIGGSKDLQTAMDKIATSIVTLGDLLQSNGPAVIGVAKIAAELWGLHKALTAITAAGGLAGVARGISGWALANPVTATIGAVGLAFIGVQAAADYAERGVKARAQGIVDAEVAAYKALVDGRDAAEEKLKVLAKKKGATNEEIFKSGRDLLAREQEIAKKRTALEQAVIAAQLDFDRTQQRLAGGGTSAEPYIKRASERLRLAKEAFDRTVGRDKVLASGGGASEGTPVKAGKKAKDIKDTTDELIASLLDLHEAENLSEQGLERLVDLRAREQAVINAGTEALGENEAAYKRVAEAQKRIERIDAALNPHVDLPEQADQVALLADNYDMLSVAMRAVAVERIRERIKEISKELHGKNLELEKEIELRKELAKLQGLLYEKNALGLGTGNGKQKDGDKPERVEKTRFEEIMDDLKRIAIEAPTDIAVGFFSALGEQMANGGNAFRERMRSIFSNIFGALGSGIIRAGIDKMWPVIKSAYASLIVKMGAMTGVFGKFLASIQKALANPLTAGLAMIAIGAGMVIYGAKMGAAGRGGGDSLGGGFGGLSIGAAATKPTVYTFDNRNPFAESQGRTAKPRESDVTVNATIIGPNDPTAQRQIAEVVNNAARRGLLTGGGGRTG